MRILFCIPQLYNSGGMERVLCQKVNWLAKNTNYELAILTTEVVPEGRPICYFELNERVRVDQLNLDFDADFNANLLTKLVRHQQKKRVYKRLLSNYIREHQVDLCVSLCGKEIAFLSELPCKTIAEVHFSKNQRQLIIEAYHSGRIWTMLGKIRTHALVADVKKLQSFVCLTQKDLKEWQEAGCGNAICIPNPCSLDGQSTTQEEYLAPREKMVIGVGRLHPQKGFDRLIRAWEDVATVHPDWKLSIIGEGEERESLKRLIRELHLQEQVSLPGRNDNMSEVYKNAALLVLSSRYEGLPLAMIEAMWCGTPCVAFDCPQGPAELLNEERGILVEEGNIPSLAKAINDMIEDDQRRRSYGERSFLYAREHFSEQTIMQQWIKLFEECK